MILLLIFQPKDKEAIDRQFYGDGASDSEDEGDNFLALNAKSRQEFDDGNVAAEVNESYFVASMLLEAEQNNEEKKIPGAPDNCKQPSAPEN